MNSSSPSIGSASSSSDRRSAPARADTTINGAGHTSSAAAQAEAERVERSGCRQDRAAHQPIAVSRRRGPRHLRTGPRLAWRNRSPGSRAFDLLPA
jgi:hypothetical protein